MIETIVVHAAQEVLEHDEDIKNQGINAHQAVFSKISRIENLLYKFLDACLAHQTSQPDTVRTLYTWFVEPSLKKIHDVLMTSRLFENGAPNSVFVMDYDQFILKLQNFTPPDKSLLYNYVNYSLSVLKIVGLEDRVDEWNIFRDTMIKKLVDRIEIEQQIEIAVKFQAQQILTKIVFNAG